MKVNVNPEWSIIEVVEEAQMAYTGSGITSRGYRNSVLKVWVNMVGKKRALREIDELISRYGSKKAAGGVLDMSTTTFYKFLRFVNELPDPPPTRKPIIFLCYGRQDEAIVRNIYENLILREYEVWFDKENLVGGQDWDVEIQQAVRRADLVITCLSQTTKDKTGYVQKEIRIALDAADYRPAGKSYIIPLRLEECDVPLRLQQWQWVDYFRNDGFDKLIQALEANEIPVKE